MKNYILTEIDFLDEIKIKKMGTDIYVCFLGDIWIDSFLTPLCTLKLTFLHKLCKKKRITLHLEAFHN